MVVLKCKMCGGDIELSEDKTFGTCEYCGCTMTLPKINDDQKAVIYNRGNHFRRIGEYDKALAVYERIVSEDDTDAEAHWCCALSRFGIEYVEDPSTYEWVPTCHRLSFDSFLEDVDYLAALEYSDGITRRQYQKDAMKIAEVQKGILAVSQKEEPFDVFICYKESDENNNRTIDSTLAQDIYYRLTDQGFKVFFSRITLEDKAGTEYEPYIFAALNSAKVMIVVGTKPEYLDAVWVKNEWSRFLQLMKKDRNKVIIPCYRDMDPYDLPEQLSVLQSYDMARIGFVQDLIRGISKIAEKDQKESKPTVSVGQQSGPNVTALLDRGYMSLEDKDWDSARKFFDEALNMNARCAEAYLGLAMADTKSANKTAFGEYLKGNDISNRNYDRAKQFAGEDLKKEFDSWTEKRKQEIERQEQLKLESIYADARTIKCNATRVSDFRDAAEKFRQISGYRDSDDLLNECLEKVLILEEEQKVEAERRRKAEEERTAQLRAEQEAKKKAEAQKRARIEALKTRINELGSSAVQGEGTDIKKQIKEKEQYLKTLGIFKGKEKEATRKEIEVLKGELEQKKKELFAELCSLSGDTVLFGHSLTDQGAITEWVILAEKDDQKLLIAKNSIGQKPYHSSVTSVTWETCSLRRWLNSEYLNKAFSDFEKSMILVTDVKAHRNLKYTTDPGRDTKDKIFLLSITEAQEYFKTDNERKIEDRWWLRSPGYSSHRAANVGPDGSVNEGGNDVSYGYSVVRPALWVKIN